MAKPQRIRRSLKFSLLDGLCAATMTGLTADYLTPYALTLKASASQIGFLSAAPNLVSSLVQLKSPDVAARFRSRVAMTGLFVFLHALMLVPIIMVPYVFRSHQPLFLIIFVTLCTSLNAFAVPAWSSLMSDHVPARMRGLFFGWRNRVLGSVTIVAGFAAGCILHVFHSDVLRGFLIIFSVAFLFRVASAYFLARMYEPPLRASAETYFSPLDFIRRIRESNFARFVIFVSALNFCVNIAAPFFSVFMLRDLKFNYLAYTVVVTSVAVSQILTFDRWGRIADRIGTVKIIRLTSFLIASLPFWWILNQHPAYLVLIQVLSGLAWSGFNLCATNFIYDAVSPQKRVRCIAYFNAFSGLALCLGALLGGYLVNVLPSFFGHTILCLFLVSSSLRVIVVAFLSPKIREVRRTEKMHSRDLFYSVIGIKPLFGAAADARPVMRDEE